MLRLYLCAALLAFAMPALAQEPAPTPEPPTQGESTKPEIANKIILSTEQLEDGPFILDHTSGGGPIYCPHLGGHCPSKAHDQKVPERTGIKTKEAGEEQK